MSSRFLRFGLGPAPVDPLAALAALALGAAGGFAARALGFPLPMLLGSLLALATAALSGLRFLGRPLAFPIRLRQAFIPVIGVSIGAAFTPGILEAFGRWWPSLLAIALYIPVAHLAAYALARRIGGIDPVTAWYGSAPGGLIEAVALGEQAGGDPAVLTMLQFLRLILCILIVPFGFTLLTGHPVGSAAGAVIGGSAPLAATDWAILVGAGIAGAVAGTALRLPAGIMTGPILVSGAVHLAGLVEGGPPRWLIDMTQVVIGTSLGVRFAGKSPSLIGTALRIAGSGVVLMLLIAGLFAAALHGLVGERWEAVFLSFAPGGLAEMSLIALSLELSVIYVTAHHVLRIVLAVTVARALARRATRG